MKFLLTSNGLTNPSITNALFDLVGKKPEETTVAFIPTAALVEQNDKCWFILDLGNIAKQNFKRVDIVEISALPRENWEPGLRDADVIFVSGGNTHHLMYWVRKSGLAEILPELLKTKVYASISAGSMIIGKGLDLTTSKSPYYEDLKGVYDGGSLGYLNFHIRPHLNSPSFPSARKEYLEAQVKELGATIYALDNESALKIVDDKIEVISEGEWLKLG